MKSSAKARSCCRRNQRDLCVISVPKAAAAGPGREMAYVEVGEGDPIVIWILGGTFRMGSDKHYPEEAPVHRVTVDGFWIDRTPVTNRQFKEFVRTTGYVTYAEIPPDPKKYPSALPPFECDSTAEVFLYCRHEGLLDDL